jgi:hypothetical protein
MHRQMCPICWVDPHLVKIEVKRYLGAPMIRASRRRGPISRSKRWRVKSLIEACDDRRGALGHFA